MYDLASRSQEEGHRAGMAVDEARAETTQELAQLMAALLAETVAREAATAASDAAIADVRAMATEEGNLVHTVALLSDSHDRASASIDEVRTETKQELAELGATMTGELDQCRAAQANLAARLASQSDSQDRLWVALDEVRVATQQELTKFGATLHAERSTTEGAVAASQAAVADVSAMAKDIARCQEEEGHLAARVVSLSDSQDKLRMALSDLAEDQTQEL